MKFSVLVSLNAIDDIQEAINYYDGKVDMLGSKFEKEVDKHFSLLERTSHFQIRYDEVRCLPLKKFPYMIHYRINETKKIILIEGVICCFKDPEEYWLKGNL